LAKVTPWVNLSPNDDIKNLLNLTLPRECLMINQSNNNKFKIQKKLGKKDIYKHLFLLQTHFLKSKMIIFKNYKNKN